MDRSVARLQRFVAWLLLAIIAGNPGALAAAYRERPIRYIVPSGVGGAPDILDRIVMTEVGKQLGQQFVVDNRPGASGTIGTELIVRAVPDGYTLGHGNILTLALNRSVLPKLPYDLAKIEPIVQATFVTNLLAVTLSLPVKSVQELVEQRPTRSLRTSAARLRSGPKS